MVGWEGSDVIRTLQAVDCDRRVGCIRLTALAESSCEHVRVYSPSRNT